MTRRGLDKPHKSRYLIVPCLLVVLLGLALGGCSSLPVMEETDSAEPEPSQTHIDLPPKEPEEMRGEPMKSPGSIAENITGVVLWTVDCDEFVSLRTEPSYRAEVLEKVLKGETVEVVGFTGLFAKVKYGGQDGYILSSHLKPLDGFPSGIVSLSENYNYEQMLEDIDRLQSTYPGRVRVGSIGESEEGRLIPVMMIGEEDARYHVLIQGAIHGREHATAWLVMAQAEFILSSGSFGFLDGTVEQSISDVTFHVIPMANPDGVIISQSKELSDKQMEIYEKDVENGYASKDIVQYAARWKANANGVDLNRNFDAAWETMALRDGPSSERHKGAAPEDQNESRALAVYAVKYPFAATVSYHASGSVLYYDYGEESKTVQRSLELAWAIQTVTGYMPIAGDDLEAGGFKDWAIESLGIPSVTVEIGCHEAPLMQRELCAVYERNKLVLPAIAHWIKAGEQSR